VKEHVLRLDVAMNDALAMRVIERRRDFGRDANRVDYGELSFPA